MSIDEMIAVLQAAKAGKVVQYRSKYILGEDWRDDGPPAWSFTTYDYRVKPEPREWWLELHNCFTTNEHETTRSATVHNLKRTSNYGELIKVREVLE